MLHFLSVDTYDEADEIAQRFQASGIPVFVEHDYTRTDPSSRNASFGFRIHLWLENQLEDAKRLLRDPDYEVLHPVNVEEFYTRLKEHDAQQELAWHKKNERWLNWAAIIAVVGLAAWIAYAALKSSN